MFSYLLLPIVGRDVEIHRICFVTWYGHLKKRADDATRLERKRVQDVRYSLPPF